MGKIVAIGGGEDGRHGTKYKTALFDNEIIRLTGKDNPNFLFIGLANNYPDYYFEIIDKIYGSMYNCKTDYLTYEQIKSKEISSNKINNADIIYVGGGNTYKLMRLFSLYGIDEMLRRAYDNDKVLCGVSAGGICWCDFGNSDSRKFSSNSKKLIRVSGLGLIHILFSPHFNREPFREESVKEMMRKTYKVPAIMLDNAAIEIVDNKFKILKLAEGSVVKKSYWKNGKYIVKDMDANDFQDISLLYSRS